MNWKPLIGFDDNVVWSVEMIDVVLLSIRATLLIG